MATQSVPTIAIPAIDLVAQSEAGAKLGCLLEQIDAIVDAAIDGADGQAQALLHGARELLSVASGQVGAVQVAADRVHDARQLLEA